MNILMTGGTGFIGSALTRLWAEKNHTITILSRKAHLGSPTIQYIKSLDEIPDDRHFDAAVNLAGYPLFKLPLLPHVKQAILNSRLTTTRELIKLNKRLKSPFQTLISGSAVGIYGDHRHHWINETSHYGTHFGATLCKQWESLALEAQAQSTRVCLIRTGIVLGEGGALAPLIRSTKYFLPIKLGDGTQYWPWIDLMDQINAIDFLLTHPQLSGPFNLCSPHPITQTEFIGLLAKELKKTQHTLPFPAWLLKTLTLGAGDLLLDSQRVTPSQLLGAGFKFKYEDPQQCLQQYCR